VLKEKPMRKIVALCVVSVLAACGSDSEPAPTTVTGSIAGSAFLQKDQAAFLATGNSCNLSVAAGIPVGVSLAVAELTDYAGLCTAVSTCGDKSNSKSVTLIIARANVVTGTAPGFANESYGFIDLATIAGGGSPTLPPVDSGGSLPIFTALVTEIGATPTCIPTVIPAAAGSTLKVTSSTSTSISGTVNLVLASGAGTLTGGFSASTCAGFPTLNACTLLDGILGGTGGGFPDPCNGAPATCN
jgi:hypothetical protein